MAGTANDEHSPASSGAGGVRQLRLIVEAADYEQAVTFYRDVLGLLGQAAFQGDDGARVTAPR